MDVSFFMPEKYLPDPARREAWKSGAPIQLEQAGKGASVQSWIFQTWLHVQRAGLPAKLVHEMPDQGIVIALTGNLAPAFRPKDSVFLVGVVADGLPHAGACLQILQNAAHAKRLAGTVYMPHWTQPNLLGRDSLRGDRFEEIRFFGDEPNLCEELREMSFRSTLESKTGIRLLTTPATAWHDFRSTDCAFAIRSFDRKRHDHKPPTKMLNAWLAGVPFLGGSESAYSSEGRDGFNYLSCSSKSEFLENLKRLKADPDFRRKLVHAGTNDSLRHTQEAQTQRWISLIVDEIPARWKSRQKKSAVNRRLENLWRRMRLMIDRRLMD